MSSLAGSFLVARHVLQDKHFYRTVVLLLKHNEEGAFGLVVNRPAKADGIPFPVFSGGPRPLPRFFMLPGPGDWVEPSPEEETQGAPGGFPRAWEFLARVAVPS